MQIAKIKKIHFIGIGGIGVSATAKLMLKLGKKVSGSDLCTSEITDKLEKKGAKIFKGHHQNQLDNDTDLVVYSDAVPPTNPERIKAEKKNIEQISYFQFLGIITKSKKTIAVSGTNGKTTTSAILGKVLADLGLDPTVIIGSQLQEFDGNLRFGHSKYFVIEADEYYAHMLSLLPWCIFLTNIDIDHLDFYKDLNDIIEHFQKFVDGLPPNGVLFYAADDKNIQKLKLSANSFGCSLKNDKADYQAKNLQLTEKNYEFDVYFNNEFLEHFKISLVGKYNVLNTLLVIGFCHQLKMDLGKVKKSLAEFANLWRRFETLGYLKKNDDVLVISDYTHHPQAVKKTLQAAKEFYPNRRLFLIYQPHQHNRTKSLFNDFIKSFNQADLIIIQEIYDVAGRKLEKDENISSSDLVQKIISQKHKNKQEILFAKNFKQTKELLNKKVKSHDLLLIMGAGDIDNLARELTK
ncbi:UDP-N-acetylmuramate--L-alanine ligase [Patescibacteria group bacterium]|nr:UDP-N-acetylmuramate--L-alanine ligase [Patescibacteria group bacterium]